MFQPDAGPVGDNLGFTSDYWQEVLNVLIYSAVGIVILNVARIVVDRVVLYQFSTEKEIIEDRNAGTGAVEFGVYVAVSLVIAGSISGEGGGPEHSLVFLALGLATLVLYTLFYELTTPYKIHDEIERNNASVGVALGGNLIAIGIISLKAIAGDFVGWSEALAGFVTFALLGFILLLVVRRLTDFVLFPRVKISNELAVDQNLGVGLIMAAVSSASARSSSSRCRIPAPGLRLRIRSMVSFWDACRSASSAASSRWERPASTIQSRVSSSIERWSNTGRSMSSKSSLPCIIRRHSAA